MGINRIDKVNFIPQTIFFHIVVFGLFAVLYEPPLSDNQLAKLFFGWAVFEFCLVVWGCYQVHSQWKIGEDAFRILENKIWNVRDIFLTQQIVDQRLKELAHYAQKCFQTQLNLSENEVEDQLEEITESIKRAKADFGSANEIAKSLAFHVRDSIRDYTK